VIERVAPQVDGGRFPAKREVGDLVTVEADVYADGHDELVCDVLWREDTDSSWRAEPMEPLGNDRWRGVFPVERQGVYRYSVRANIDAYGTWVRDAWVKLGAGQDLTVELLVGAQLLGEAARRAEGDERGRLDAIARGLREASETEASPRVESPRAGWSSALGSARHPELLALMKRYPDRGPEAVSGELQIVVDRPKARFSSWYELFPRSWSAVPGRPGTLSDVRARLDYVSGLGFDVLYLPPIHPIGRTNRKGRDGARVAAPQDPGSPWAVGAPEGGHTAVHPELGTIEDLESLVVEADRLGMEIALDLAFQCSADHPWVKEHPEWFSWLPDGTVRYAENPPKRYEDIYPIHFGTSDWRALWAELLEVVLFWVSKGIRIFRVDNPHTKPLRFWGWLIEEVHAEHPDVIFLAEAFTRPQVMHRLAKGGFTQSYTYFAWRNTKWELEEYLAELHSSEVAEFFRPNFWPNTPDILTEALQLGGRPAFMSRLVLAATSAASYGIYGPVFELCENRPRTTGSEEYLHSEKYEIRHFDLDAPTSLAGFVTRVNQIRRESPVLQHDRNLVLCPVDNDQMIAYVRTRPARVASALPERTRPVVVVVNLDPRLRQSGWVELDLQSLGIDPATPFEVHDMLTGARYQWQGPRNFVILDPAVVPAHILSLEGADETEEPL
jgi:starch synthase (maltosyl-transferring)